MKQIKDLFNTVDFEKLCTSEEKAIQSQLELIAEFAESMLRFSHCIIDDEYAEDIEMAYGLDLTEMYDDAIHVSFIKDNHCKNKNLSELISGKDGKLGIVLYIFKEKAERYISILRSMLAIDQHPLMLDMIGSLRTFEILIKHSMRVFPEFKKWIHSMNPWGI